MWGNNLALHITGGMAELPQFKNGTKSGHRSKDQQSLKWWLMIICNSTI